MRRKFLVILAAANFIGLPALAQATSDGTWSGQSFKCTPTGNFRQSPLEISNGMFSRSGILFGWSLSCDSVQIGRDGSFEKDCGNGVFIKGRVLNNKLSYELETPRVICEASFKRG